MAVHWIGVVLVYAGLVLTLVGVVSLVRPFPFLRIASRRRALAVLATSVLLLGLGLTLPATERRVQTPRTALDRFIPVHQFSEHHQIRIAAPPGRAFDAVRSVTASEITFFRTLTAIRRLGRPGPEGILNAPEHQPILDVATQTSFILLAHDPDEELVVGTIVSAPNAMRPPDERTPEWFDGLTGAGYAKAVMSFRVEPDRVGALVTTETRVYATDNATRRRFTAYWRVIYPGSALIRRMWLRAIQRRAEAPTNERPVPSER